MLSIDEKIIFAGYGGQGIVSMGRFLAIVCMNSGYNTTWIPAYGAEVRGGTAYSMVRIKSRGEIFNPVVTEPQTCVVLNKASLDKYIGRIAQGGMLLADSYEIKEKPVRKGIISKLLPFTDTAVSLGSKKVANVVSLGALNKIKGLFPEKNLVECLSLVFGERRELVDINVKAYKAGTGLV